MAFAPDGKTLLVGCGSRDPETRKLALDDRKKLASLRLFTTEPEKPAPVKPEPEKPAVRQWTDAAVLNDHGDLVNGVAIAPDGKTIVATAANGMIMFWDAGNFKRIDSINRSTKGAYGLSFAPDGTALAVGSDTGILGYELPGLKGAKWEENHVKFGRVDAVAFSPDGTRVAASDGYVTRVRSLDGKGEIASIGKHPKGAAAMVPAGVAWSKDGKRLALIRSEQVGDKWPVVLWSGDSDGPVELLAGHMDRVTCVAWSADGKVIASGDEKGTVILWDAATGKELWRKTFHGRDEPIGRVNALAFSPADTTLAAAVSLHTGRGVERVVLLNSNDGKNLEHLMRPWVVPVTSLAWAKDGNRLVTGCGWVLGLPMNQNEKAVGEVVVWERKP